MTKLRLAPAEEVLKAGQCMLAIAQIQSTWTKKTAFS
jgi:hypothetical protein